MACHGSASPTFLKATQEFRHEGYSLPKDLDDLSRLCDEVGLVQACDALLDKAGKNNRGVAWTRTLSTAKHEKRSVADDLSNNLASAKRNLRAKKPGFFHLKDSVSTDPTITPAISSSMGQTGFKCMSKTLGETSVPHQQEAENSFLVVVVASTRAAKLTWNAFEHNVLRELNADLALAVSKSGGASVEIDDDPMRARANYIWEIDEPSQNEYSILISEVAQLCGDEFDLAAFEDCFGSGNLFGGSGMIHWYFRWLALQKIVQLGLLNYTHFIVTRSDNLHFFPHPRYFDNEHIFIPEGEDYAGINDRHAVVPRSKIAQFLDVLEGYVGQGKSVSEVAQFYQRPCGSYLHAEMGLKSYLGKQELKVERFPRFMFLVNGVETRQAQGWTMQGNPSPELGGEILVKYKDEFKTTKDNVMGILSCLEKPVPDSWSSLVLLPILESDSMRISALPGDGGKELRMNLTALSGELEQLRMDMHETQWDTLDVDSGSALLGRKATKSSRSLDAIVSCAWRWKSSLSLWFGNRTRADAIASDATDGHHEVDIMRDESAQLP